MQSVPPRALPSSSDTPRQGSDQGAAPGVPPVSVAPLEPRFEDVRRIAVLRGGGLGDFVFALGAIESLAAAYPDATITLLGTPLHAALLAGRPSPVADVVVLPVHRGVRDVPGTEPDEAEIDAFFGRMRAERFDLAVQLHGGGRNSNPFLLRLGARHTVGLRTPDAAALERDIAYVYYQHEVLRSLEVVGLAGAAPSTLEPTLMATEEEIARAEAHVDPTADGLVLVHPGATDPRRRWPDERFAEVAGRLAADGRQVVVIGDGTDVVSADAILGLVASGPHADAAHRVSSLAGTLGLGDLVGLMARADLLIGNDSGPRHLAQAVGVSTVGVYWIGNLVNAGPLGRSRHRAHLSWTTACPVCGTDVTQVGWTAERCEHDPSFVAQIAAQPVYDDAAELTARSLLRRG